MDVVAGILGIEAEIAQEKGRHSRILIFECKEPVHQAYKLGLAAAMLLVLAQAIANLLGGCTCVCSREEFGRSSADKQMAAATLVLSWIIFGIGFTLLTLGAISNSQSRTYCGIPHRHFLSVGGVLSFVNGLVCVVYYVSSVAVKSEEERKRRDGTLEVQL